jgi:hypothetical protein
VNNTPFRRYKHFTHEGGVATPLIAHWPQGIPPSQRGRFIHQPAHLVDVMPTVLSVTAARYPARRQGQPIDPLDGYSFAPAFQGKSWTRRQPIYYFHEGNRGVRDGNWKLVMKYRGEWELYDMDADRTELHNLAAAEPERTKRMAAQWDAWAARTHRRSLGKPRPQQLGRGGQTLAAASQPPSCPSQTYRAPFLLGAPPNRTVRDAGPCGVTTIFQIVTTSERIASPRSLPDGRDPGEQTARVHHRDGVYNRPFMIDEMRRSIPKHATLSVIRRIHSVQLEIRRSTLEKE